MLTSSPIYKQAVEALNKRSRDVPQADKAAKESTVKRPKLDSPSDSNHVLSSELFINYNLARLLTYSSHRN